jgi:hypothetical protein
MLANLNTAVIYCGILTLENVVTVVKYHGIFISLASIYFELSDKKFFRLSFLSIFYQGVRCLMVGKLGKKGIG